ncbi:MAG: hypothetical protein QG610_2416, partial [Euryarchaeota archaeon]|nr:hypothetical protein [Euryarchaeota archaeon]
KIVLLDWELNETVRKIIRKEKEPLAVKKRIREQLFEHLREKELYFIMGTHFIYGTWLITGIFGPEKESVNQKSIFDFRQKRTVSEMNKEQPALNR